MTELMSILLGSWWRKKVANSNGWKAVVQIKEIIFGEVVFGVWDKHNPRSPIQEGRRLKQEFYANYEQIHETEVPERWGTFEGYHPQSTPRHSYPLSGNYEARLTSMQQRATFSQRYGSQPFFDTTSEIREYIERLRQRFDSDIDSLASMKFEPKKKERKKTGFGKFVTKHNL